VPDDERRVPEGNRFRNGYRLLLGRRSQGVTGSASNGAGHNGASLNGETLNGETLNGKTVNGSSRNGHHGHGITVGGHVLPIDVTEGSVDLLEVQADDLLIDTVGAGSLTPDGGDRTADDRLVALLAAWRAEVDATPIPELVDLDTAVAAVLAGVRADAAAARRRRSARARHLAPLAAAAALIVTTVAGIGMGSQNAVPGDTLWPVQKVFNSERAESVEAKVEVEVRLEKVRGALTDGDRPAAARELAAIRSEIPAVRTQEGQPLLVQEEEFLAAKLEDTPPGAAADLSTPALSKPDARPTSVPTDDPADPSADADPAESTTPSTAPSEATSSVEPSAEPSGGTTEPAPSSGTSTSPAPDAGLNPSGLPGQTAPGLLGPGGTVTSGPSGTTTSGSAGTNVNATGTTTAR
jgi:Anti-sigma-D factor RsdA to sigma factor binding region